MVEKMFKGTLLMQIFARSTGMVGMVVDGAIIGTCMGLDSMAAYGFVSPVNVIFGAIAGMASVGVAVLCGKCVGKGDIRKANTIVSTSIIIFLAISALSIIITSFFSYEIASLLGAEGEIRNLAAEYIKTLGFCLPARSIAAILMQVMQLDGDKNRITTSVVAMTSVNVILDLLNGYMLHFGLWGMGICSSASYYIALIILLLHFKQKDIMLKLDFKALDFSIIKDLMVYGFPFAVQQFCKTMLTITLNMLIFNLAGSDYVAAFAAIMSATNLFVALGDGIGSTVSMLTGVFSGEKDKRAIRKLLKVSFKYSVILNGILSVFVIVLANVIMSFFLSGAHEIYDVAVLGLRLVASSLIIYSFNSTFRFYFQTMHKLTLTYVFDILGCYVSTILVSYLLSMPLGIFGVWLGFPLGEILTLGILILVAVFSKGGWIKDINDLLFLPKNFGSEIQLEGNFKLTDPKNIAKTSENIRQFCLDNGISSKNAMWISLFSEEMTTKIIEHGFCDNEKHSIEIRLSKYDSNWIIRIRDDCMIFNPMKYMTNEDAIDELSQIGIKIVQSRSNTVDYFNTLKMNNLVIDFPESKHDR